MNKKQLTLIIYIYNINNMNMTTILSQWINALLTKQECPVSLFDCNTFMEDGRDYMQYWQYEKQQFIKLAPIYDLTEDFSINILNTMSLSENKFCVVFYLCNSLNRIVYKMTQTVIKKNNTYLLSGNNKWCQLVPKFIIKNNSISGIGLAIESPYEVIKIISPQFQLEYLQPGSNHQNDNFYSASFIMEDIIENNWYDFYLTLKTNNGVIIEKRKIYFDNFIDKMIPYHIDNNLLTINNENYPVNLSMKQKDSIIVNYSYPRNLIININNYNSAIVTDCLDNDWHLTFNS